MNRIFIFISIMAAVFGTDNAIAQSLFEGKLTYYQSSSRLKDVDKVFHLYCKGYDFVEQRTNAFFTYRVIYTHSSHEWVSISCFDDQQCQIERKRIEKDTTETIHIFRDSVVDIKGYTCIKVEMRNNSPQKDVKHSVLWVDTSYRIPFHYGYFEELPYGLVVKTELTVILSKGSPIPFTIELLQSEPGLVDEKLFVVPEEPVDKNVKDDNR